MKTNQHTSITPANCVAEVRRFLNDNVAAETVSGGIALALPLMYPDGYQVVVRIEQYAAAKAWLTDGGVTLAKLAEQGLNIAAGHAKAMLDDRLKVFGLQRDGLVLSKDIRLPLDGLDVQLFAECLVSVAHLANRIDAVTPTDNVADQAVRRIFQSRQIEARTNVELTGFIEKSIRVDYFVERRGSMACQVVRRRGPMLALMEQWAWRWTDLAKQHPTMIRAMLYNPDAQDWDKTSLSIGQSVCDVFCPYYDSDAINEALDRVA